MNTEIKDTNLSSQTSNVLNLHIGNLKKEPYQKEGPNKSVLYATTYVHFKKSSTTDPTILQKRAGGKHNTKHQVGTYTLQQKKYIPFIHNTTLTVGCDTATNSKKNLRKSFPPK